METINEVIDRFNLLCKEYENYVYNNLKILNRMNCLEDELSKLQYKYKKLKTKNRNLNEKLKVIVKQQQIDFDKFAQ